MRVPNPFPRTANLAQVQQPAAMVGARRTRQEGASGPPPIVDLPRAAKGKGQSPPIVTEPFNPYGSSWRRAFGVRSPISLVTGQPKPL